MNFDGRVRDWAGKYEVNGDEYEVYYCWVPVDDPKGIGVFSEKVPSQLEVDKPFYEIYAFGHKKPIHKTFHKPTEEDFLHAKYRAANSPDYLIISIMAFNVFLVIWALFIH